MSEKESILKFPSKSVDYKTADHNDYVGRTNNIHLTRQLTGACAVLLLAITNGATNGYSAILLPQLSAPDSPITLTLTSTSWLGSMSTAPLAIANIVSGILMEKCGRRICLLMACPFFVIGGIGVAFSRSLWLLLTGRFLIGICQGIVGPILPVYMGEISSPKLRTYLLPLVPLCMNLGILFTHIIGTFLSWQWTAIISLVYPALAMILLLFLPETYNWFINKKKYEEAIASYTYFQGDHSQIRAELEEIISADSADKVKEETKTFKEKMKYFTVNLKRPEVIKPLLLCIVLFLTCDWSGINVLVFYTSSIFKDLLDNSMFISEFTSMITIDVVRVVSNVVMCYFLKIYGRRPFALLSAALTSVILFILWLYITLIKQGTLPSSNVIVIIIMLCYVISTNLGLTMISWILVGEIFPGDVRSWCAGISVTSGALSMFSSVIIAPSLFAWLSVQGAFLLYGVVAFFGAIYIYIHLPETKNKTLREIEQEFQ